MGTDISYFAERRTPDGWEPCGGGFYCGEERNYALFAILAGVRRMTNGGFEPIVPPRGFPADSPTVGAQAGAAENYSAHNATWLTLRELLDFPWHEKKIRHRGWVDAEQFRHYLTEGRPRSLSNASAQLVSNEEMKRLIETGGDVQGKETLIEFGIPYAEYAGPFVTETIPWLQRQGEPEDVRLIMSFDS